MTRRRISIVALISGAVLLGAMLRQHPALAAALPACPIHQYLGILCPGCGATHALLALLHGHIIEAVHANVLFVALLPASLWFAVESCRRGLRPARFVWPAVPRRVVQTLLFCAVAFTIARNVI